MRVIRFPVGPLDNNVYVIVDDGGDAIVIDPSFGSAPVLAEIRREGWSVRLVVNTHGHLDHVAENQRFVEASGAPLAIHRDELPVLDSLREQATWFGVQPPPQAAPTRLLGDGDRLDLGGEWLQVIHTPGHSPGGICLTGDGFVISGDTLFAGSVGRTDLPGGSMEQLSASIRSRLLTLPDDTRVYPGHGDETTIGRERRTNPFL